MARLRSLIRPSLISLQTKLIGVSTNGLPAVITLKVPLIILVVILPTELFHASSARRRTPMDYVKSIQTSAIEIFFKNYRRHYKWPAEKA